MAGKAFYTRYFVVNSVFSKRQVLFDFYNAYLLRKNIGLVLKINYSQAVLPEKRGEGLASKINYYQVFH